MKIVICGPYSGTTQEAVAKNVRRAWWACAELFARGHEPYCPHTQSFGMEFYPGLENEDFMRGTLAWIEVCDAILLLPGWEASVNGGCKRELQRADELEKIIFERMEDVPDGSRT